jgi:pyruvate/2-oxoacid:ferredoxin oxidoreductase beta subunit
MNTGIQRSGATPPGAWTNTTMGALRKTTRKKDMPAIMAAHGVPYVATLNPAFPEDFLAKAQKAAGMRGTRYLHVLADCPTGWKHDPSLMAEVGRLATQSLVWPLFEVENGVWRLTRKPGKPVPVKDYISVQGRFSHLKAEDIAAIQADVDARWNALLARVQPSTSAPQK